MPELAVPSGAWLGCLTPAPRLLYTTGIRDAHEASLLNLHLRMPLNTVRVRQDDLGRTSDSVVGEPLSWGALMRPM